STRPTGRKRLRPSEPPHCHLPTEVLRVKPRNDIPRDSWRSQWNRWCEPKCVYPQEWRPTTKSLRLHLFLWTKAQSAASREPRAMHPARRNRIATNGYQRHHSSALTTLSES